MPIAPMRISRSSSGGDWLVVFNKTIRRPVVLHPPQDPEFRNWLIRSSDEGESWSAPQAAPNYDWHGVECAGLTDLGDGRVMLNQWRFHWQSSAGCRAGAAPTAYRLEILRRAGARSRAIAGNRRRKAA